MKAKSPKNSRPPPEARGDRELSPAPPAPAPPSSITSSEPQTFQLPLFLGFFFLCVWLWIDVGLIYHGGGVVRGFPVFFWGMDFARDLLRYPGGPVDYLSAWLAQSLYYSWLGALVLTFQAGVILVGLRGFLQTLGARKFCLVAFIAPWCILFIYAHYAHASAQITGLALAICAIRLYQYARPQGSWPRCALVLGLASVLYEATPAGFSVFVLTIAIQESRKRAAWLTGLVALGSLAALPYLEGVVLAGFAVSEAYEKLLPIPWDTKLLKSSENIAIALLYLLVPISGFLVIVWHRISRRPAQSKSLALPQSHTAVKPASKTKSHDPQAEHRPPDSAKNPARAPGMVGIVLETGGLLLITLVLVKMAHHSGLKSTLAADNFAWHGQWPKALASAGSKPGNLFLAATAVQASFHTGQLTQQLPEVNSAEDMLLAKEGPLAYWRKSDIYYDIGYVNMALHYLIESVEFWGERPALLARLAALNRALGNIETARIYLRGLSKAPFHRARAAQELRELEGASSSEPNAEVNRLRNLMPKVDSVVRLSAEDELLALLEANPQNRMAFEYLMTHYLLTRNLTGFLKHLPRIREFPGFELSSLWKEAMVLGISQSREPVALKGLTLDTDAQRHLEQLLEIVRTSGGDKTVAQPRLKEQYAKSYFYYFLYGR